MIYTPTLIVSEGYAEVLSQQIKLTMAEYDMANPYVVSTLFDLRELPTGDIPDRILNQMEHPTPVISNGIMLKNLKLLQDAGINIAAGTDAGNIGTLHGPAIFREFELMAEAGLTPMQVLTAATINGAKLMGRFPELGSITPVKLADLVILNADPLEDIRNVSDIYLVMKDGKGYTLNEILKKTPEDIVQQQVNAYNARDIDAFLATYSPEIKGYNHPDSLIFSGLQEMRSRYQPFFENNPKLHGQITNRISMGRYVIDQEYVTGLKNGRTIQAAAIYEIQDAIINRVWFIPKR